MLSFKRSILKNSYYLLSNNVYKTNLLVKQYDDIVRKKYDTLNPNRRLKQFKTINLVNFKC